MAFYVYILASQRNGTLYVGMTDDLVRRVWQHREGAIPGFTEQHHVTMLVWYEAHESREAAFQRENGIARGSSGRSRLSIRIGETCSRRLQISASLPSSAPPPLIPAKAGFRAAETELHDCAGSQPSWGRADKIKHRLSDSQIASVVADQQIAKVVCHGKAVPPAWLQPDQVSGKVMIA